jgi:hypothetical protein
MKAKKLKIYIKTSKFSVPIPALRFSTLRWISKIIIKYGPSKMRTGWLPQSEGYENIEAILKNITCKDVDQLIDQLEQEEPFEMVDIETYDEKEGNTVVKIYTVG